MLFRSQNAALLPTIHAAACPYPGSWKHFRVSHKDLVYVQARNGSLFPSAVITLYVTYLGYSALQSEPHDYECNGVGHRITAASATTLALGMLLTLLSVVYSALRAGSNTRTFLTSSASGSPTARDVEEALLDQGTSAGLDGAPDTQTMSAGEFLHMQ